MSNQQSNNPFVDPLSFQRNIQGDYAGNIGSQNFNCFNTTNYFNRSGTNSSQNYAEILRCLYPADYASHRNRVREPVEGTCTWVTEHPKYKEWLGNQTSGSLWLSADPGCGKSVIASFLVTHLKTRRDTIVCYFFFKDDSEEQRSAKFALRAILHQLFVQRKSLCMHAQEAFEAKGNRFTEEVDTLWDILVKVAKGGCGDVQVICVLDALDECEEVTLAQLIRNVKCLHGSQTSDIPLKFLVTSRPYHKIEKELSSRATTIRLKGEEEINAITADVTRFIDGGIKELESVWENPGGLEYLRDLLESKADRTFLWVSLVLDVLKDSEDSSREEFINLLSTSPKDLAEFYAKILDKSTDANRARRLLHIVVAAARPLTLVEMHAAFKIRRDHRTIMDLGNIPHGFEKILKNLCGLFVRVIDSKIYLVHQTAREFLIKGDLPGQGSWQYTLCPMESSIILADICISYLSLEDFQKLRPSMDTSRRKAWEKTRNHLQKKYALLDYAASYWAGHFRDSRDRQLELFESTRPICERGSGRFLTWLNLYWKDRDWHRPFPNDFTHLVIASWLGQRKVVERLLEEEGEINARSKDYGTALNIAALRGDEGITKMLLDRGVNAYLCEKEYNILKTTANELVSIRLQLYPRELRALDFLKRFCLSNTPNQHTLPDRS